MVTNHAREDVVYYLDTGNSPIAFFNHNERQDVADFYKSKNPDYKYSGFDISIPAPSTPNVTVYALVKGSKEVILNLKIDGGDRRENIESQLANEITEIKIKNKIVPQLLVVDNFYEDPDSVRELALQQSFAPDLRYHKGQRTNTKFIAPNTKQIFETLLGRKIIRWTEYEYNGIFQYCTAEDPLVYHCDVQSYAAAVYLTPNAPIETGTSFYRSKIYPEVRSTRPEEAIYSEVFAGGYYDKTNFELVDTIGNVYNRLAIWNSRLIHSASEYFGNSKENGRLFHLFFFDIEE